MFLFDVLLIFGNLAFADVGETVVLVVLAIVETDTLAVLRNSHWYKLVDEPVAEVADCKCIDNYYCHGNQMIEEYYETFRCASYKTFLNEDTREDSTKDTTCSVGWENVEGIVYP